MPKEEVIHRYEPGHGKGGEYMGMEETPEGHWCAWEDVRALRDELTTLRGLVKSLDLEEPLKATALLDRIVKYAREDRASTPGVTRLARALTEAEQLISRVPAPAAEPSTPAERLIARNAALHCDKTPRPTGCQCHLEVGDSPCPVHGLDESEKPAPVTVTAEDRAVLEAMAELDIGVLEYIEKGWSAAHPMWHPPALAELARRRAAKEVTGV
jgi:hypothetical protein